MSRHLVNLDRLCSKWQLRYGDQDPLCQQLQQELDARKAAQPAVASRHDWSICERAQQRNRNTEFTPDTCH